MSDENWLFASARRAPWDKGKLVGAKPPLRSSQVRSIRTRLLIERRARDLALFNLAIDSKLRGCDVIAAAAIGAGMLESRQAAKNWGHLKAKFEPALIFPTALNSAAGAVSRMWRPLPLCPHERRRSRHSRSEDKGRVEMWRGGCRPNISVVRLFRLAVP
jgi:hypothetical protein